MEGRQSFKDAKLFPGGAREWDFPETGTNHVPGIQPADVEELLQHGVPVVVLSKGIYERLQVCPETLQMLKTKGIPAYILQTEDAVRRYNELGEKERVGAFFTRPAKQTARRNPMRRQACRLSGIGVALGLVMYWAPVAPAEIREVRLGVEGMCPECATELEEALSRVEGVATVQVSVEPPQARLTLKAGQPLEVAKLRRAVAGVELTPTWIRFEALGVLTIREGTTGFRVQGTAQVITLASDRKLEELMATVRRDCEVVLIEGLISPGEATARIERFEVRGLLIC